MGFDLTPDEVRRAEFRTVLRGLDKGEVTEFLDGIAAVLEELQRQRDRLVSRAGEYAGRDLESEFDTIGREVAAVLQTAREAADSMRERAGLDAARWRSESMAEAEQVRKEARSDAEALRGDAWTTGSELLNQALTEGKRVRQEAERDVLTITGEAEREARRLVSAARREAEALTRTAAMDAEKMSSEATKRRDDLINQAQSQAEVAQERTRALEERRKELLKELEKVRSTLGQMEGTLEERRENLNLSASSTVRIVPPTPMVDPSSETWQPGETVRIVSPDDEEKAVPVESPIPEPEPEPKPEPEPESEREPEPEPKPTTVPEPEPGAGPEEDEVGALFASLRGDALASAPTETTTRPEPVATEGSPSEAVASEPPPISDWVDVIEARDAVLLPITNRALRGVKKAVTGAQNIALDHLRTDDSWQPDRSVLADTMRADLIGLWAESYSAGHQAAEEMAGKRLKRKDTPSSEAADDFGDALASAVSEALVAAGAGQRERQSATSRVFRAWRTDEAERRIRELALMGFHGGLIDSVGSDFEILWVPAGTPCSACREAATDPASNPPPLHPGCECTLGL